MASDMKVGLTLEAEDRASAVLRRASSDAARQAERTATRSNRAVMQAQRTQEQAMQRQQSAQTRAARAREQLGIRSERAIRREIQLTEAAYNRLARSGRLSASEQARAYGQMQQRVAGLRQEMVGLERVQRRGLGSNMMRVGAGLMRAGVAGAAATAVLARPISRTMDYDQRLRYMANTAFGDGGQQSRQQGYEAMKSAIADATKVGGTRDEAAGALGSLLNAGAVSGSDAMKLLPTVQTVAVGSGSNAEDVAKLANALVKTGGISVDQIPQALDMFVKAAKEGAIEFADLARGMPQVLAAARQAGMTGIRHLPSVLGIVEGSMATAGSADQAITNTTNWLSKINSPDTIRAAAKIQIAPGESIDLMGQLAKYQDTGLNTAEAFDKIMDRVVASNPNMARVEKQLRQANPESRQKILESQYALFEGSALAQMLPDQQAIRGYLSYRYTNQDERRRMVGSITNSQGAAASDLAFINTGPTAGFQALKNQQQNSEFEVFKGLTTQLGELAGKTAELAAEYPGLAQATVTVTEALLALGAVAGSAALLNVLRSKGKVSLGPGAVSTGAVVAGEQVAARAAAGGGSALMRGIKKVGVAGPAVAGLGAFSAYQVANNDQLTPGQKTDQYIELASRSGGAWAGMRAGAVAGSSFGPYGALAGGVLGGIGGDYLGNTLAQYIQHLRETAPTAAESQAAMAAAPNAATLGMTPEQMREAIITGNRETKSEPQKIDLNVTVDVRGGNIVAEVNRVNDRESRRH